MILKLLPLGGTPKRSPAGVPVTSPRTMTRSPATRTSLDEYIGRPDEILRDLSTERRDHSTERIGGCDSHRRDQKSLACPDGYGRGPESPRLECLVIRLTWQEPRGDEQRSENDTQYAEAEAGGKRSVLDQRTPNEQG